MVIGECRTGGDDVMVVISGSLLLDGTHELRSGVATRLFELAASLGSRGAPPERDFIDGTSSSSNGRWGEEDWALDTEAWKSIVRFTGSGVSRCVRLDGSWGDVVFDGESTERFFLGDGLSNVPSFGGVMSEKLFCS